MSVVASVVSANMRETSTSSVASCASEAENHYRYRANDTAPNPGLTHEGTVMTVTPVWKRRASSTLDTMGRRMRPVASETTQG